MYCITHNPSKQQLRQKYNEEFFRTAEKNDTGGTMYVQTRYVVLYANAEQKVPLARIQDCHKTINRIYAGQNTAELAKVPNTTYNPWKPLIGTPNIQFLPLDSSKVTAEYISSSSPLNGSSPVSDAAQRGKRINGVLNIYIGNSGSGGILGQAEIGNNVVYVLHSAVGGDIVNGTLDSYNLGKTLAHEIGHALSLPHTFTDDVCDGVRPFPDIPESIRPNFATRWVSLPDGTYDLADDNRYNDRASNFENKSSCLHFESKGGTVFAPNDMGCNIMDYGDDTISVMFSKSQALMMRSFLNSEDNTSLALKMADETTIPTDETAAEPVTTTLAPAPMNLTWVYALSAVIGVLVLAALLYYFMVYRHQGRRSSALSARRADVYEHMADKIFG